MFKKGMAFYRPFKPLIGTEKAMMEKCLELFVDQDILTLLSHDNIKIATIIIINKDVHTDEEEILLRLILHLFDYIPTRILSIYVELLFTSNTSRRALIMNVLEKLDKKRPIDGYMYIFICDRKNKKCRGQSMCSVDDTYFCSHTIYKTHSLHFKRVKITDEIRDKYFDKVDGITKYYIERDRNEPNNNEGDA